MISQHDIEAALYREWPQLRQQGAFRSILPDCQTRQWMRGRERVGYVTLDYRLHRRVEIPEADRHHNQEPMVLLEQYWSVRTLDGRQDPSWLPSLNLHVVQIRSRSVGHADVECILRDALVLQAAARLAGHGGFDEPKRAQLHVRALLLGADLSAEIPLLVATETVRDVELYAATFRYSIADGFSFAPLDESTRLSLAHEFRATDIKALGEQLIGEDTLPARGWTWNGTNDGPVYDSETGLTIDHGRVL